MEISKENINPMSDREEEEKTKKISDDFKRKEDEKINIENIPDKNTAFQLYKTESSDARETENTILTNQETIV